MARRVSAGETGSPLRPWADTVATLEVMDRVRAAAGIDFAEACGGPFRRVTAADRPVGAARRQRLPKSWVQ